MAAELRWKTESRVEDLSALNLQGALRHIIADLLGSVGVIAVALVILLTDWLYADPIISVLIGFLVLGISCKLLRDSTNILLEQTPRGIDANEVGRKSEGGTLGSRCAGMLSHGEVAEWTWARGSQIWTSRCYGCGCWVLILLDGPRMRGLNPTVSVGAGGGRPGRD